MVGYPIGEGSPTGIGYRPQNSSAKFSDSKISRFFENVLDVRVLLG
jgi:hypothetical protein